MFGAGDLIKVMTSVRDWEASNAEPWTPKSHWSSPPVPAWEIIARDNGRALAIAGYDALRIPFETGETWYLVVNPAMLALEDKRA